MPPRRAQAASRARRCAEAGLGLAAAEEVVERRAEARGLQALEPGRGGESVLGSRRGEGLARRIAARAAGGASYNFV